MKTRLIDDHVRIRAIAADLLVFLTQPVAPVEPGFARSRWELMRELATHLAYERRVMSKLPSGSMDDTLDEALRSHMLEWTGAAIARDWLHYRVAARALLRRLHLRMDHEERSLFRQLA